MALLKRPTQVPTHECTFGTQKEVFYKNICFVLNEITEVVSFTLRWRMDSGLDKIGRYWVGSWWLRSRSVSL